MLPRSSRVTTKRFDAIMKEGRVMHSPLFILRVIKNTEKTRVAAVVPKKIAKTAVLRNKLRRFMYDSARPVIKEVGTEGPSGTHNFEAIIFAKQALAELKKSDLSEIRERFRQQLKDLLTKS